MKKYIVLIITILFVYFGYGQCTIQVDFENEVTNPGLAFNNSLTYTNPASNWRVNPGGVVFDFAQEASGNQFLVANDRGGAPSYISNVTDCTALCRRSHRQGSRGPEP